MSVKRAIHLKGGGTLLLHNDGKKTYIPSMKYREFKRQYTEPRQFRGKPATGENCFRLLAAIIDYSMGE